MPLQVYPLAKRMLLAGIQSVGAPTTGKKEINAPVMPQNIGSGIPKIRNPFASSAPCTSAMIPWPNTFE